MASGITETAMERTRTFRTYSDFHVHLVPNGKPSLEAFTEYTQTVAESSFLARRMVLTGASPQEDFAAYHCDCLPEWSDQEQRAEPPIGYHVNLAQFRALVGRKDIPLNQRVLQFHAEPDTEVDGKELADLIQISRQRGAVCVLADGAGLDCNELLDAPNVYWELSMFEPSALTRLLHRQNSIGDWLAPGLRTLRAALSSAGVNGHPPQGKQLTAALPELASVLGSLVQRIGSERLLYASGRTDNTENPALQIVAQSGCVTDAQSMAILFQNAERLLDQAARKNAAPHLPLFLRFVSPYTKTDPAICTGSMLIDEGLAQETRELPEGSVLLSPCTDVVLSRADAHAAKKGLCLLDAPWETLEAEAAYEAKRGLRIRRIPDYFVAQNPFYRNENPRYFSASYRLGTAEAAGVSLFLLGCIAQARSIFHKLAYLGCYEEICAC